MSTDESGSVTRVCPACGSATGEQARFCSNCGLALNGALGPRHLYGVLAPGPTLALALLLLLGAILVLLTGSLVGAIALLAGSGATFVLFYGVARRNPESSIVRRLLTYALHARGWAVFGKESAEAWTTAAHDLSRLRREAQRLRRERRQVMLALGEAAYSEDGSTVTALRLRLHEIDDGIATRELARAATLAKARRHVSEERTAARPTQQFSVEDLSSGEGEH